MKISLTFIFLFLPLGLFGQMEDYNYKQELIGVEDQWHRMLLPDEIYKDVKNDLSDIRIFGLDQNDNILEAPYILNRLKDVISKSNIPCEIINQSSKNGIYYFTLQMRERKLMNNIQLNLSNQNFDWKIDLQGGDNPEDWFDLLNDYRIVSIKNESTDYRFTKLVFPDSKYSYYRIGFKSNEPPKLQNVTISTIYRVQGKRKEYSVIQRNKSVDDLNVSIIDLHLTKPVPVSQIKVKVLDEFDFYRHIKIDYVRDSIKIKDGWKKRYNHLNTATLSSLEKNIFTFNEQILQEMRISVYNRNNQALEIGNIAVSGYAHELVARFTEPAKYYLTYGNKSARKVGYDIARFQKNIPLDITSLKYGSPIAIEKEIEEKKKPLFENKTWLWVIMIAIICLLGWFTFKMINQKE